MTPLILPNINSCDGVASWVEPTGFDLCGTVVMSSTHSPGDVFPLGDTEVKYYVTDDSGNQDSCSFIVTIIDDSAPVLNNIGNQSITSLNGCDASLDNYIPLFTPVDNCAIAVDVRQEPIQGSLVDKDTVVMVIARDLVGNEDTSFFLVEINGLAPSLSCPGSIDLFQNTSCEAIVRDITVDVTGGTGCGNLTYSQTPLVGSVMATPSSIIFTATNGNGDVETCTIATNFVDTIKPNILCPNDTTVYATSVCANILTLQEMFSH